MNTPVICFGQQPCGFFPKRFLAAKIQTARRLQREIGGQIVFFLHDSDHDPRETRTLLRHRKTQEPAYLNFACPNKVQRKFSPLFLKRIAAGWQDRTTGQLPNFVEHRLIDLFKSVSAAYVADFCLDLYRPHGPAGRGARAALQRPGLPPRGLRSDGFFRGRAPRGRNRARAMSGRRFDVARGRRLFITLPLVQFTKEQISPTRDSRLRWMQSVIHCTHYIAGAGEQAYLRTQETPEITFVNRDAIDRSDEAFTEIPPEPGPLLAFGAHPDDLEFACGGVIARETRAGRPAHLVICSRGEAGTPRHAAQRTAEANKAAALLGATLEFLELDGDAHLEIRAAHAIRLAGVIRRVRPGRRARAQRAWRISIPITARLGRLVRDAARLARYGGLKELRRQTPHAIGQLFFYAVTPEAEPRDITPGSDGCFRAGNCRGLDRGHAGARVADFRAAPTWSCNWRAPGFQGLRAGVGHAIALFPNDPLVVGSLAPRAAGARRFLTWTAR